MKVKVVYIISKIQSAALEFVWVAQRLDASKIDLTFILLNEKNSPLELELKKSCIVIHINYKSKKSIITALPQLWKALRKLRPDIIHTHMLDANILGLFCGKLLRIKDRIYTRHHSSLNHEYYKSKVFYDHWANRWSTKIVAVSQNVADILVNWEKVDEQRITVIPHGIDLRLFTERDTHLTAKLKEKYNPENNHPVIGVISRYTHWKGIQYVIPAFKKLLQDHPKSLLILANARKGEYVHEITKLLKEIPHENYIEIPFEKDIHVLYNLFDIFVHVPIDYHSEAFGQIYVEALATGIPSVLTISGIARDLVDNSNAVVVEYKNSDSIYHACKRILNDASLRTKLKSNGPLSTRSFRIDNKIQKLEDLYLNG